MATLKIAVIGDRYGRNEQALFLSDLQNIIDEMEIRLWQRKTQIEWIPLSHANNFRCTESVFFEGGTCQVTKVVKAVNDYYTANPSSPQGNFVHVLSKNLKSGGGGQPSISGGYFRDRLRSGSLGVHELSHNVFGLGHTGGFMNSSGSNGADGWRTQFTPSQLDAINTVLNTYAGAWVAPSPTITIDNAMVFYPSTGAQVMVDASVTGDVQQIDIKVDGVATATLMYWGDRERNFYCNPDDGIKYYKPLTSGSHTVEMTATDVNGVTATDSVTVTVQ